jgi:hypothetical protein
MTQAKNDPTDQATESGAKQDAGFSTPKWMISVPEMPTQQEVQERRAWVAALYPQPVIDGIAKAARFTRPEDISDMAKFLLSAGYMFQDQKDDRHPGASFAPDRKYLERIAQRAGELEIALANLSDISAQSLWHPFQRVITAPPTGRGYTTHYGLTVHEVQQPDGAYIINHLRPHQIEESVYVIRRLAELAAADLPDQRGGQPQYGARQNWIISAQNFWRAHSPLAFDPRSIARDFCFTAFLPLDGSITPRQIDSAVRAANKDFPVPKRRRPNAAQESR